MTLAWLAGVLCAVAAPSDSDSAHIFALIIANNRSIDESVTTLRYADDDGARFYELMTSLPGATVELLASFDQETQQTFSAVATQAKPPTLAELRRAVDRLVPALSQARARGEHTAFYLYFAGHGNVGPDREGYLNLADTRLTRSDIFREVVARVDADVAHVIIDACNSYFAINRGEATATRPAAAVRSFLESESLDRYPQVGVVLSTASEAESHEWSRFRSGVFSHQLLSALLGAADVDADGQVRYQELAAYVAAANANVRDTRARLVIYARPPAGQRNAALLDLRRSVTKGATLIVPQAMSGHYYLEDDRGVRTADFNKTDEQPLRLALLTRPYYYLRSPRHEALVKVQEGAVVDAGALAFAEIDVQGRGSVEHSLLRDLYTFPFGRSFLAGYEAAGPGLVMVEGTGPADMTAWKWTTAAVAGAGSVAGITLLLLASRASQRLENDSAVTMERAVELQKDHIRLQTYGAASLGVAAMAAIAYLAALQSDGGTAVTVSPGPAGAEMGLWLGARF